MSGKKSKFDFGFTEDMEDPLPSNIDVSVPKNVSSSVSVSKIKDTATSESFGNQNNSQGKSL